MSAFLRFAAVGAAGFVVNAAALWIALHVLYLNAYLAWLFAFVPAVSFTWWGNRMLTFREQASDRVLSEWARFVATNAFGALVNFAVYAALVRFTSVSAFAALAAGVLAGLAFNFTLSKTLVFRPPSSS